MIPLWENQDDIPFFDPENPFVPHLVPYTLESSNKLSCIIVFPGGGYTHRAQHEGEPVCKWLNSIGISAFLLNYRVLPYKHPAPLLDAKRSIRLVRYFSKKWNIDPNRIGVWAFLQAGTWHPWLVHILTVATRKTTTLLKEFPADPTVWFCAILL